MHTNQTLSLPAPAPRPRWLLACFWLSIVIALAAALRRLVALLRPSEGGPPASAALDSYFAAHAALTALHILPAALFIILAAFVMLRRSGSDWPERLFFPFGAITAFTAYAMSRHAVGGWLERSAVLVFNTWFLFSLGMAYRHLLQGDSVRKRQWMTRAVAIVLGIATTRPVMGLFFATSTRTHLEPSQFFGVAFWIGFSLNSAAVEFWLRARRSSTLPR